jgi:two-component system, OmpR family, sensor kinase
VVAAFQKDPTESARERLLLLGEIAGEIAHELRNALQVVSTHAYLARQDPTSSATHIAKIEKSARLAQTIVDDVLSLARGEPLRLESTTLDEVIALARAQSAQKENASVVWEDPKEPHELVAHPLLLSRLFKVLFENAAQAGATRVTVTASSGTPKTIVIADDGPGIPSDLTPRIFEPLATAREGGTGLGLSLAKRIADAHHATLALTPSDRGARFTLAFSR